MCSFTKLSTMMKEAWLTLFRKPGLYPRTISNIEILSCLPLCLFWHEFHIGQEVTRHHKPHLNHKSLPQQDLTL